VRYAEHSLEESMVSKCVGIMVWYAEPVVVVHGEIGRASDCES
jgi:hypothetical protein